MTTIASLRIETWGNKFVIVGEFENFMAIPRREFDTYREALQEFSRAAQREEKRYEAFNNRDTNR